uniref:Uncharacterized protein LOC116292672 n=1 Tax=Actinia tenebrosa TaxID=6105 RepID=A0A6P8HTC5_ACTTE
MSSKLVKKGLDFVSSTNESIQEKRKNSQKKKRKSKKESNGCFISGFIYYCKVQKKDDFTQQNLKYFKHSAWSIKKDTYEKIVQHQEKKLKKEENPTTEEIEDD